MATQKEAPIGYYRDRVTGRLRKMAAQECRICHELRYIYNWELNEKVPFICGSCTFRARGTLNARNINRWDVADCLTVAQSAISAMAKEIKDAARRNRGR